MNFIYKRIFKLRERYIDTLGKLYDYATVLYEKNKLSVMLDSDMSYTYGSFKRKCDEISHRLSRYGIGAGDKVAILSQNMPNWTVAMFSLVPFGRVSVPILPDSSENEVTNILNHSGSKAIFISRRLLPKLSEECKAKLDLVIDIETFEIIKRNDDAFTCDGKTAQPLPDDIATIIYTSGTTGNAKGVMLSHRNLCHNIIASLHAHKCYGKRRVAVHPSDGAYIRTEHRGALPYFRGSLCVLHPETSYTYGASCSDEDCEADRDALGAAYH